MIIGQPVSWKNSSRLVVVNGRRIPIKGKAQAKWAKSALEQLKEQWGDRAPIPKSIDLNARIVSYLGNRRSIDASNLYQGPEDMLQKAKIIEDDCCIRTHNRSDRRYDPENPRVEIELTEVICGV